MIIWQHYKNLLLSHMENQKIILLTNYKIILVYHGKRQLLNIIKQWIKNF